jgi:hypothetical protein
MAANQPRIIPAGMPLVGLPSVGGNDTAALLKQFTQEPKFLELPLTPNAYRNAAVGLKAVLSTAAPTGQDTYRVPTTHNLVVWGMRGHFANIAPNGANEAAVTYAGNSPFQMTDLIAAITQKAMLVTIDLQNQDRNEKLVENRQMALSDILELVGGAMFDWSRAPLIVMGGQTIQLDLGLAVSTTADIGDSFEAGVILDSTLVRCREG